MCIINKTIPHRHCFGYLMISLPNLESEGTDISVVTQVAEPCLPPFRHEQGSFLYRVCSDHPISALTGPALDAPPNKTALYPGQIIQVECKIQFARSPLDDLDDDSITIMFLKLKHRRCWIPDQQPNTLLRKGSESTVNALVEEVSYGSDSRTCVLAASSIASPISILSDFDVHSILSQPTPRRSLRSRRPSVPQIFHQLIAIAIVSMPIVAMLRTVFRLLQALLMTRNTSVGVRSIEWVCCRVR
jgi:hypothetical protein